jgi:3-hydroxybutyryl-CoA dehydrogenase
MTNISIIGSGTMGNGIAHVFAQFGYHVSLVDVSEDALKKAITTIEKNLTRQVDKGTISDSQKNQALQNITTTSSLKHGVENAELVVEAATENLDLKLKIFRELDSYSNGSAILATNTSSISISKIASVTSHEENVIGMHFMNPVPLMKLVEVIRGKNTSEEVTHQVMNIAKKLDKIPVEVNDSPGFVANRVLMPMINEAICSLHEGVSGVAEIDTVMKLGMSHPMGPLQLADFIGLDVCLSIMNVLYEGFGTSKYAPSALLVDMVNAGNLGIKSRQGFYDYQTGSKELIVSSRFNRPFSIK